MAAVKRKIRQTFFNLKYLHNGHQFQTEKAHQKCESRETP